MRLLFLIIISWVTNNVIAQTVKPNESCKRIEGLVRSAINSFSDMRKELLSSYEQEYDVNDGPWSDNASSEEYATQFRWPGTDTNYIHVFTFWNENARSVTLNCPFFTTSTEEKAYAQFKKIHSELNGCAITPLPGQKVQLKGVLPSFNKTTYRMEVTLLNKGFKIPGGVRSVRVELYINKNKDNKYFTLLQVVTMLNGNDIIIPKCEKLNEIARQLAINFSGHYGDLIYSEIDPPVGFSREKRYYKANKLFRGSDSTEIMNEKIKTDGKLKMETWTMLAWYDRSRYEEAIGKFKKIYQQLQGCSITSPQGRQVRLNGEYIEPGKEGGDVISFNTSTENERFVIDIQLEKEGDYYTIWLTVSLTKTY